MTGFIQLLVSGVATGCIFGLVGLCFVFIYQSSKVVNFAQGEFVMAGALLGVWFMWSQDLPFWVALPAVAILAGGIGLIMNYGVLAPLRARRAPVFATITGTLAVGMIVTNLTLSRAGPFLLTLDPVFGREPIRVADVAISTQQLLLVIATLVIVLVFWMFLSRTPTGVALRATGHNPTAASLMGVRVSSMIALSVVISTAVSGIAGLLITPITGAQVNMGLPLAMNGFIAGIIGGFGSPFGAVFGGLFIGVASAMFAGYVEPRFTDVAVFGFMLVVLLLRPTGLFAEFER